MLVKDLIKYLRKLEKDNGNLPVEIFKYNTRGGSNVEVTEVKIVCEARNKDRSDIFVEIS